MAGLIVDVGHAEQRRRQSRYFTRLEPALGMDGYTEVSAASGKRQNLKPAVRFHVARVAHRFQQVCLLPAGDAGTYLGNLLQERGIERRLGHADFDADGSFDRGQNSAKASKMRSDGRRREDNRVQRLAAPIMTDVPGAAARTVAHGRLAERQREPGGR